MDKKVYTEKIRALTAALQAQPKEVFSGKKFLVTGIMLDSLPVLDLLEELNVAVVDDLLCHESMQFRTPTRKGGPWLQAGLPVPGPEGGFPPL